MNSYIATFFSHFGAMTYCKRIKEQGIEAKLMPVPRKISSSCGTCVSYKNTDAVELDDCELESIYFRKEDHLECILRK